MIWDRPLFKAEAKNAFRRNYWPCVAVGVILAVALGALGSVTWRNSYDGDLLDWVFYMGRRVIIGGGVLSLAVTILLVNPFEVGANRFFMENRAADYVGFNRVGFGFTVDFGNVVLTRLLEKLYVFLWSLLFVVPGIVRAFGYFCVPFILAENPKMEHTRVLELSRAMTMGHKSDIFVTYLSFLGWIILSGLSLSIVGIFYVFPYMYATNAEMYAFLRQNALDSGLATRDDLPGFTAPEQAD